MTAIHIGWPNLLPPALDNQVELFYVCVHLNYDPTSAFVLKIGFLQRMSEGGTKLELKIEFLQRNLLTQKVNEYLY